MGDQWNRANEHSRLATTLFGAGADNEFIPAGRKRTVQKSWKKIRIQPQGTVDASCNTAQKLRFLMPKSGLAHKTWLTLDFGGVGGAVNTDRQVVEWAGLFCWSMIRFMYNDNEEIQRFNPRQLMARFQAGDKAFRANYAQAHYGNKNPGELQDAYRLGFKVYIEIPAWYMQRLNDTLYTIGYEGQLMLEVDLEPWNVFTQTLGAATHGTNSTLVAQMVTTFYQLPARFLEPVVQRLSSGVTYHTVDYNLQRWDIAAGQTSGTFELTNLHGVVRHLYFYLITKNHDSIGNTTAHQKYDTYTTIHKYRIRGAGEDIVEWNDAEENILLDRFDADKLGLPTEEYGTAFEFPCYRQSFCDSIKRGVADGGINANKTVNPMSLEIIYGTHSAPVTTAEDYRLYVIAEVYNEIAYNGKTFKAVKEF